MHYPDLKTKNADPDLAKLLWFLLIITSLRCLWASRLPLLSVEAYYWLWGHHPAAGYYDHPRLWF